MHATGYPIATTPLSILRPSSRPFGLALTTRAHAEHHLLRFACAWEALFPRSSPASAPVGPSSSVTPPPLDAVPPLRNSSSGGAASGSQTPDAPIIRVILKEWDTRDFGQSSDALAAWLNARWRKSGYRVSEEVVWGILQASGREAWRGLGDRAQGAFAR